MGFNAPWVDMSGNGFHIIISVDIKVDDWQQLRDKIQSFYGILPVDVDTACQDLSRVFKVPGTWSLKGDNTLEKPYRRSFIISTGDYSVDKAFQSFLVDNEVSIKHIENKEHIADFKTQTPHKDLTRIIKKIEENKNMYKIFSDKFTKKEFKELFESRSEAEYYLVYHGFIYGLQPGDIPAWMAKCRVGKWQESKDAYKELTIKKAYQTFMENPMRFFFDKKFVPAKMGQELVRESRFLATDPKSHLWRYNENNGLWENSGEKFVQREVKARLKDFFKSFYASETEKWIRYGNYIDIMKINSHTMKICMINGVYDLETNKFWSFSPEYYSTTGIPVIYDPEAKCPKILKFIGEIVTPKDVDKIIELFGYCLYKSYSIHNIFVFNGAGRNGKSQLLVIYGRFLGEQNTSNATLQQLSIDRFTRAQLFGKLANIAADIPAQPIKYTGIIKMLSGGDRTQAQFKFQDPFEFRNFAKMLFSANMIPPTEDTTPAFYSRMEVVNFPNQFLDGDPNTVEKIGEKISTPEELSGLFNLAIQGLKRLLKNGKFTGTKSIEEKKANWIKLSNIAQHFVVNFVTTADDPFEYIEKGTLYAWYARLGKAMKQAGIVNDGAIILPSNLFSMEIKKFLPYVDEGTINIVLPKERGQKKPKRKSIRVWRGINLQAGKMKDEIKRLTESPDTPENDFDDYDNTMVSTLNTYQPPEKNPKILKYDTSYHRTHRNQFGDSVDPDSPGEKMAHFALKFLEREGGSVGRILFMKAMYGEGYHGDDVIAVIGKDPRFGFDVDVVRLNNTEESE
jgi:putative DNA primase/helicase